MLTLVTPPAVEPVTLADAKLQVRQASAFTADDTLLTALITAAREKCESYLCRSFITSGWRYTFDGFPGQFSRFSPALGAFSQGAYGPGSGVLYGTIPERLLAGGGEPIVIPHARMIGVSSITYLDTAGTRQTLDPSKYDVEAGDGGRITPAWGSVWPSCRVFPGSVVIDFTLGYGDTAGTVPGTIRAAILLLIAHLYENRESVVVGAGITCNELPMGVRWLLASQDWGAKA